jgi:hypothetical protein
MGHKRLTLAAIDRHPLPTDFGVPQGQYGGTSLIRKRTPLEPYRRPMPWVLGGSWGGGGVFLWARCPSTARFPARSTLRNNIPLKPHPSQFFQHRSNHPRIIPSAGVHTEAMLVFIKFFSSCPPFCCLGHSADTDPRALFCVL